MKQILLLLTMLFLVQQSSAQFRCGTDIMHQQKMLTDTNYAKAVQASNDRYMQMMQTNPNGLATTVGYGTKYQIPVVVHVIHKGGAIGSVYNPTDSAIKSMIAYLNQSYAATYASYPDSSSGGTFFPVEFVLAKRADGCGFTEGIVRVNGSSVPGYASNGINANTTGGASDASVKALSRWNNHDYYNVWIVSEIDNNDGIASSTPYIAGYAYYPGITPTLDGIVMLASTVYAGNITLPHEIGHAFNLRHTFEGDGTGSTCPPTTNCTTTGDLVCDTEPHKRSPFNCPSGTNPCTGNGYNNVQHNFMDYSNCQDRFTAGQKVRWMDALLNDRAGLASSIGSVDTGTNVASNSCTMTTANTGNGYDIGPALVILNDLTASSNGGYSQDNYEVYLDRSCQQRANVIQGQSYTLSVKTLSPNAQRVAVYIDYNNNGSFSSGELVYAHTGTISGDETHATTFTVPSTGITTCVPLRMRVLAGWVNDALPTNGCGNFPSGGQAEDYSVVVKPASANITATISGTNPSCSGSSVTFTVTPSATLTSPTYQWYLNSVAVGTNSTTYTAPTNLANGSYLVCKINYTGACGDDSVFSNTLNIVRNSTTVTPAVGIGANPGNTICSGTSVTFTATPTNGGTTPLYQWKLNGSNVGSNSTTATYTNASLSNNDVVTCVMTSSEACASPTTATSSGITMSVTPSVTPSVGIAANPSVTICSGTSVTFTATPTNGGTTPLYQWKVNGSNIGTNSTTNTYTNASLSNNDVVSCVMTSNASCASPTTATSNNLTMSVTTPVTPSVAITANTSTTICAGTSVTFTATPTNGGAAPLYQWKVNGSNVGTNSTTNTYTSTTLSNGDVVSCVMTSNATCVTTTTASSNNITMTVNPLLTPSVTIGANPGNTVCAGLSVTFTAIPTNGGTAPLYQWKVNGSNVGTNSTTATYTSATLANNDQVTCVMTSNATCASPTTATSAGITMVTTGTVEPAVSIAANTGNTICNGTSVTFTATPTNGGVSPLYQWKLNGSNVGGNTTTNTYTNASLSNSDVVSCVITSSLTCASPSTGTSNNISMTVNATVTPSVSIAVNTGNAICAGTSVTFTATPTNGGTAPLYQWKVNGSNVGGNTTTNTFTSTALANNDVVTCVMTSNAICPTPSTATSNGITMSVTPTVTPSVSIAANTGNSICSGTSVTFTATPTNGGTSPTYQWKVNGSNVGTNSTTYTSATLANNDQVTCVMTSNATCATPTMATSSAITMSVTATITPTASINIAPNDTICSGTPVTYTVLTTGSGTAPTYQWKKNGANVGTGATTYINASPADGDIVSCQLTSNATCATVATVMSDSITLKVNPNLTPSVAINSSIGTTICAGTSITFTATPTNGGSTPLYQWKVNGSNVGTNSAVNTYTSTTLSNNDVVTCVMTSSETCVTATTATSNGITMSVTTTIVPTVTISNVAPNDTVCAGTLVGFSITSTGGGTSPTYQWKVNGTNVGTGGTSYSSNSLLDGDVVTCVMTSSETCAIPTSVTSTGVTMTVNPNLTPSITIAVSPNDTICAGTTINFTATPTNGGATPTYRWRKNGSNIAGAFSATYSTTAAADGDVFSAILISSEACLATPNGTSNDIAIKVNPNLIPAVSISANPGNTICAGTSVTFTAVPTNGGAAPLYQWKVNGTNVGTNSTTATYTTSTLSNTDVVSCVMTSNETCLATPTGTSNNITMTVNPNLTPSVTIAANTGNTICAGTSVIFTATPVNGGTSPSYQWKVNGANVGTNSATFVTNTLSNGDAVTCVVTSNATCLATPTGTSAAITMTVNPNLTPSVSISVSPNDTICAGTSVTFTATPTNGGTTPSYQWKRNGVNVGTNSSTYTLAGPTNGDVINCVMTSNETCLTTATGTSNSIRLEVKPNLTPSVSISISPNDTICAGTSVTFTANPTNGGATPTYQWKVNGANVGTGGATYTTATLTNADVVTCVMTSSEACVTTATGTSNSITMTVNPNLVPFVSITVSPNDTICAGTSVTFTSSTLNGGTNPIYRWMKNGTNIGGATSATYTSSSLADGDVITCRITSNETCLATPTATSTGITMEVMPNVTPLVTISVSPKDTICDGALANFTAIPVNGGTSAAFQWKLNGTNVGGNSFFYSNTSLSNNDVVSCEMTSSLTCVTKQKDTSNNIAMTVIPLTIPTVSISTNVGTTTCKDGTVIFSSSYLNGGTSRSYQWKLNNTNIAGATGATYTTTTLNNGDKVHVDMTIVAACPAPATVQSDTLIMSVTNPAFSISVTPNDTICSGTPAMFAITATDAGNNPQYQWYRNNQLMNGVTSPFFTILNPNNGDAVTATFTGSANCVNAPLNMDTTRIGVTQRVTPTVVITADPSNSVPPGLFVTFKAVTNARNPIYQWRLNGIDIPGAVNDQYTTNTLVTNDTISLLVRTTDSCANVDSAVSNNIQMLVGVSVKEVETRLFDDIRLAPNPNYGVFVISGRLMSNLRTDVIEVDVINSVGQVVHRGDIEVKDGKFEYRIDLQDKSHSGMHVVRLHLNGRVHYLKFITNK